MGERNGLEPGVRAEGAQHPPYVVAGGLDADAELVRDLRCRVPLGEQVQDLVLPRRQVNVRLRGRRLLDVRDDPEYTDDPPAVLQGRLSGL
jgi:hypothetical protein